jgi:hypothetical protein
VALFLLAFPSKSYHTFSLMRATCPAHLILFGFIISTILGKKQEHNDDYDDDDDV